MHSFVVLFFLKGDLVYFDEHDLNTTYMALKCSKTTWTFVYLQSSTLTVNCQCRHPGTGTSCNSMSCLYELCGLWASCFAMRGLFGDGTVIPKFCSFLITTVKITLAILFSNFV